MDDKYIDPIVEPDDDGGNKARLGGPVFLLGFMVGVVAYIANVYSQYNWTQEYNFVG